MNLQMFLSDKLIGSTAIDEQLLNDPSYLTKKKKELEEQFSQEMKQVTSKPQFYIEVKSTNDKRCRSPLK